MAFSFSVYNSFIQQLVFAHFSIYFVFRFNFAHYFENLTDNVFICIHTIQIDNDEKF